MYECDLFGLFSKESKKLKQKQKPDDKSKNMSRKSSLAGGPNLFSDMIAKNLDHHVDIYSDMANNLN